MANKHGNPYNQLFNRLMFKKEASFIPTLLKLVSNYHNELKRAQKRVKKTKAKYAARIKEITQLKKLIASNGISQTLADYEFSTPVSNTFKTFFKITQLKVKATMTAPTPLIIIDCEVKLGKAEFSPEVLFEQITRLAKAVHNKEVPAYDAPKLLEKIDILYPRLYSTFADMILKARDLKALKKEVAAFFPEKASTGCAIPKIEGFSREILNQIKYLEENHFFKAFYAASDLSKKYAVVETFFKDLKPGYPLTLIDTQNRLLSLIIKEGYKTCETQRFNLSTLTATTQEVYKILQKWSLTEWQKYEGTSFFSKLNKKLEEDKAFFLGWQEVIHREELFRNPNIETKDKPLYQLFCVKYAQDPDQDPQEVLRQMPSTGPVSLLTDEVLEEGPTSPPSPQKKTWFSRLLGM